MSKGPENIRSSFSDSAESVKNYNTCVYSINGDWLLIEFGDWKFESPLAADDVRN